MLRSRVRFRRRSGIKAAYLWILLALILVSLGYYYFNSRLLPYIKIVSANRAKIAAESVINHSVQTVMKKDAVTYDSLMTFEKNENNEITAIKSNTLAMNNLKIDVTNEVLKEIQNVKSEDLDVPVGNLFGGILFINKGPPVSVKISPIGTVETNFSSVFTSSGINQTHQQVMLNVNVNITIILSSIYSINESVNTSVCVAETILVGNVPDAYLNIGGSS